MWSAENSAELSWDTQSVKNSAEFSAELSWKTQSVKNSAEFSEEHTKSVKNSAEFSDAFSTAENLAEYLTKTMPKTEFFADFKFWNCFYGC